MSMNFMSEARRDAFNEVKPKIPSIKEQVLSYITMHGPVSRTAIAKALSLHEITVGSRITELRQQGRIQPKGKARSPSGKQEATYVSWSSDVEGPGKKPNKARQKFSPARMAWVLSKLRVNSHTLESTFIWASQPEGHDFWRAVYDGLTGKRNG